MESTLLIIIVVIIVIPLYCFVHSGLEYFYVRYGKRFCIEQGFKPSRWRCGPEFNDAGSKTEFYIVEFDCMHPVKGRQLVRLVVWIFGVRKVLSIEPFPVEEQE